MIPILFKFVEIIFLIYLSFYRILLKDTMYPRIEKLETIKD